MASLTLHVLGSGLAQDRTNFALRGRLALAEELFHTSFDARIFLYGRQQPETSVAEARSMADYLEDMGGIPPGAMTVVETPKSTAESVALVVEAMGRAPQGHHVLITNWPYVPRMVYLLWLAYLRRPGTLPLRNFLRCWRVMPCGGTFMPLWRMRGVIAVPWWAKHVALREAAAWGKALVDPYDRWFNQQRRTFKR